jgi:D-glycero-alpha-D-manno-heptose-7-phosphate kinase
LFQCGLSEREPFGSGAVYFQGTAMIITKTPFRISFAGGGSDLAAYYEKFGGAVVSATIDKYIFLSMHPYFFENGYFLKYSKTEHVEEADKIEHPIIREVFKKYDIKGVDFNSSSDIPSGTGLASSSAFTCGLIHLCNAYTEHYINKEEIAREACHIEIDILGEPIGKQDQYACACGGLNFIEFEPGGEVIIERLFLPYAGYKRLAGNLMLFYTGKSRSAGDILLEQKSNIDNGGKKVENLHKMVKLAGQLREELMNNNIDALGEILHQGWRYKKELASGISGSDIDSYYDLALKNGALGGKLLGAGGGGFLLFYVKEENHERLRRAMKGLKELSFGLDNKGTSIIYYNKQSLYGSIVIK